MLLKIWKKLQQLILGYHENEEIEPRLQYDENSTYDKV